MTLNDEVSDGHPTGHSGGHLAGIPGQVDVFRYAVAEKAGVYRLLLRVFAREKERYRIQIRPEEARAGLPHYHGDFGPGGIRIGNVIIGELGARPWRFCASDYQEALSRVAGGTPFTATVPDAVWDPALAGVMNGTGREVHEEQVLDLLVEDLRVNSLDDCGRGKP